MNIPTIDLIETGKNITRLRKEKGLSVKDLQKIFGFTTPQAIYKWHHGRYHCCDSGKRKLNKFDCFFQVSYGMIKKNKIIEGKNP
ncbi:MAG: helix-turn-helix transcriptional regulator [Lachnospiraceae bacterium]|nr:helix-turn-helix transcriptional regulator [Lachnospiraceae bacterium]